LLRSITHNNHRFRVGILTVGDINQLILFARLAIIADETIATFFTVLDMFLNIYTPSLMSIITNDQQTIALAIDQLRANEFLTGAHRLCSWHLLKNARTKLKGGQGTSSATGTVAATNHKRRACLVHTLFSVHRRLKTSLIQRLVLGAEEKNFPS
jgi:hypothetical protein